MHGAGSQGPDVSPATLHASGEAGNSSLRGALAKRPLRDPKTLPRFVERSRAAFFFFWEIGAETSERVKKAAA